MKGRLLVRGGRVLDAASGLDAIADVLVEDGLIREVGVGLAARVPQDGLRVLDASGMWVLPGLVDIHVHLREPGREEDETIETGTRAAAMGGVTTVLSMPNTLPPVDTAQRVAWVQQRAKDTAYVRVRVAGAVTMGQAGETLAGLDGMATQGAPAFTDDGRPVATAQLFRGCMEHARVADVRVIEHCEEMSLTNGGCMNEGPAAVTRDLKGIPNASESALAARDLEVLRLTGGKLHLAHISTRETMALLQRAKEDGLDVTGEVCPHHFTLADEDIPNRDPNFKMNPPLRSRADVEALRVAIGQGLVDVIATDHAPHAREKKQKPFAEAPFGIIGLETLIPLSLDLVRAGLVTPLRWAELVTSGPARVLGLKDAGTLRVGQPADITVVDPATPRTLEVFASKSQNSPFAGRPLQGGAVATLVGGTVVMQRGAVLARPWL